MHIKDEMSSEDTDTSLQKNDHVNGVEIEPPPINGTDTTSSQSTQKHELVNRLIENCKDNAITILDLSKKGIQKIPDKLLQLSHLEYLYLEGNELTWLPENFFDCLANLIWLDLRNNCLKSIPSTYIGRHKKLQSLLLQGNQIHSLPLELGLVRTLTGLSLSKNPIDFPPWEVLEKGCQVILAFLRETLKGKELGLVPPEMNGLNVICCEIIEQPDKEEIPNLADLHVHDSGASSDEEWSGYYCNKNSSHRQRSKQIRKSLSNRDLTRSSSMESDLIGPIPHSASLQRRTSYVEMKVQQYQKFKKVGTFEGKTETDVAKCPPGKKKLAKLSRYPEPPPPERVEKAFAEEKQLAQIREIKEKQEMILQRRRDQEALKEWRDEGKKKQMQKYREKMIKGKIDYEEPAKKAPFGIEEDQLKVMTNKERLAQDIREKHEKLRRMPSPGTQQKMERLRMERDRELERRLKEHTMQMQERRRQPKGTPQEEMVAAKKELEIAEQLRKELEQRRKNLEYRFTAFTGDIV